VPDHAASGSVSAQYGASYVLFGGGARGMILVSPLRPGNGASGREQMADHVQAGACERESHRPVGRSIESFTASRANLGYRATVVRQRRAFVRYPVIVPHPCRATVVGEPVRARVHGSQRACPIDVPRRVPRRKMDFPSPSRDLHQLRQASHREPDRKG
jgi:hypothetical protein